jgi:tetratricopeptide (TPR) repeat protein
LELAEIRYTEGQFDKALALMNKAELYNPSAEEYMEIATLRRRIADTRSRQVDLPDLANAKRSFINLEKFESQYLGKDPRRREACRELIKLIEVWNDKYFEVSKRHADRIENQEVLDGVARLDKKYRAPAALATEDTGDDVLFAAGRPTRLPLRRYKLAVAMLNRWIKVNSGDRQEPEVVAQRNQYHKDCERWVASKIIDNKTKSTRGHVEAALSEMRTIVAECALPGSIDMATGRLAELELSIAEKK